MISNSDKIVVIVLKENQLKGSVDNKYVREWWQWVLCMVVGALLVITSTLLVIWWYPNPNKDDSSEPITYPFFIPANLTDEDLTFLNETANLYVDRSEWAARQRTEETLQPHLPVNMTIVAHTATEQCFKRNECINIVKRIQEYHMDSRGFSDIAYNFLVTGNGEIFIGRGWIYYGSHTRGYNIGSVSIAFIGTFTVALPTEKQIDAANILIRSGLILNMIGDNYALYGHRQLISTESPGTYLYNLLQTWPHWKPT